MIILIKKYFKLTSVFFVGFFVLPVALSIKIFFNYKIGIIYADRLGHLALITDLFFCRKQLGQLDDDCHYYLLTAGSNSKYIANNTLLHMFVRVTGDEKNVSFVTNTLMYLIVLNIKDILAQFNLMQDMTYNCNEVEFSQTKQVIDFTPDEMSFGVSELKRMGIDCNKKEVVCIFARDSAYLNKYFSKINWGYHDYRDMDVDSYIESIKYLVSCGYIVVRIGSEVIKPVGYSNDNFYDYSISNERTEFLDLFLVSVSKFIIGSTSGATDIAELFKVPFLAVNFAPCLGAPLGKNDLYISKKYIDKKNKVVPFKEILKLDLDSLYSGVLLQEKYGISYLDNTAEEILQAVVEMEQRVTGIFDETESDKKLLNEFFKNFWNRNPKAIVQTKISLNWLKDNKSLYL